MNPDEVFIGGKPMRCVLCGGARFTVKRHLLAGPWLQAFDLEGFGREGAYVICVACSHAHLFANPRVVRVGEPGDADDRVSDDPNLVPLGEARECRTCNHVLRAVRPDGSCPFCGNP